MVVDYEVTVYTGDLAFASTSDNVSITLVGANGDSGQHKLWKLGPYFHKGDVSTFTVSCPEDVGQLVMIQLVKESRFWHLKHSWFPAKVVVKSPIGEIFNFPIYHWITDGKVHSFREGKALLACNETNLLAKNDRKEELRTRNKVYCWKVYAAGIPHCIEAKNVDSLSRDDRFSVTKTIEFKYTAVHGLVELELAEWAECKKQWTNIHDIERLYSCHRTTIADHVRDHWKEDAFFGYQYLNGINPMLIQRCRVLPANFPVTNSMVILDGRCSLEHEIKKGKIFLCDYKILDGLNANDIHGKQQYLTAPLVLLHKTPDDKLMPIAIQLKQAAAKDNPIFTPSDSEYDWLLAKIFVRSAEFNLHELKSHLLHTHLLAEVFTVALLRNLPMVHPLYKLLIPHTRYTLQINVMARNLLISKNGVITKYSASDGKGLKSILERSLSSLTYRSLCIPDDIDDRGLRDVPNFYYRDDGLKLWNIIHREQEVSRPPASLQTLKVEQSSEMEEGPSSSATQEMLSHYYKTDTRVKQDPELKSWIQDIFKHGFLSKKASGIPEEFTTVKDLVKFVTMVIFTCSAQHTAVNAGQYDYASWMPNAPSSLRRPPPTKKGKVTEAKILKTFPDMKTTIHIMATLWLLSTQFSDARLLGDYPEEHFTEDRPRQMIRKFQAQVEELSKEIQERNKSLEVPYTYLDPKLVENSVST